MSDDRPDEATTASEPVPAAAAVTDADGVTDAAEAAPDAEAAPIGTHPVLVYTVKRVALLLAVGALLYLVGLREVWLILFAFLISGVISAVVLSSSREGAAYGITSAISRANARIDASARAEDVDDLDDVPPADADPQTR